MLTYVKDWGDLKDTLALKLHLSHDMLHVHVGILIFVIVRLVLRHRPHSLLPLVVVVALEAANEAIDFARYTLSDWPWTPDNTIADLINTLLWPLVLTLIARLTTASGRHGESTVTGTNADHRLEKFEAVSSADLN